MHRLTPRLTALAGLAVLIVLTLLGLRQFAAALTAHHLASRAAAEQALLASDKPLWHWNLRHPGDLVAGRAFGHASVVAGRSGLRVTSLDGSPFELGLPIARGLDLAHWSRLELGLASNARGQLDLIWQSSTGPACIAAAATLPAHDIHIDLRGLDWHAAGTGGCGLPSNAQMLRLRITVPENESVSVAAAVLRANRRIEPPTQARVIPANRAGREGFFDALVRPAAPAVPRIRLPAHASAEQLLALRDRIKSARPAALVMPALALPDVPAEPGKVKWLGWFAAVLYIAALALVAIRRPGGHFGCWLELVACLLGPLWLIAGLQWGLHPSMPGVLSFAGALLFAALIQSYQASSAWHWLGDIASARTWLPLMAIPVAGALCLGWGHALEPVVWRRAVAYLGWAMLQQWLILGVVLPRLERTLPRAPWPALLAALLFALMHTPNGLLMQLCFVAELWWAWCFMRSRSLLPVAIAHAASALLVGACLTGGMLRSLEVSARFFL